MRYHLKYLTIDSASLRYIYLVSYLEGADIFVKRASNNLQRSQHSRLSMATNVLKDLLLHLEN
jgi:hypothetical protein